MKGFNVMKVKTTFSTILTLMCVLMLSFSASAQSIPNDHPLTTSQVESLMSQYFGWETANNETNVTIYEKVTSGGTHAYVKGGGKWTYNSSTSNQRYKLSWISKPGKGAYSGDGDEKTWVGVPDGDWFVSAVGSTGGHYSYSYTKNSFSNANNATPKEWKAKQVKPYTKSKTPTEVSEGDILLVQVNPYWVGLKTTGSTTNAEGSRYEQCYYGVQEVEKLAPAKTPDGKLCVVSGKKLKKFLFLKRRKEAWTTTTDIFGWYDTWSTLSNEKFAWYDFASIDHMLEFDDGAVWSAPHNCGASLERNHYVSLIHEGEEDDPDAGYNRTILFYISDKAGNHWTDGSNAKNHSTQLTYRPYLSTYAAKQIEPTRTQTTSTSGLYDVTVKFRSTFKVISDSVAASFTIGSGSNAWTQVGAPMWNTTNGGVREKYVITRTYVDINGGVHTDEPVDEVWADAIVDGQIVRNPKLGVENGYYTYTDKNPVTVEGTTTDNHFPKGYEGHHPEGYNITYKITAKLYVVGANGEPTTTNPIATANTDDTKAYIPGINELWITGDYTSTYWPTKFTNTDTEAQRYQGTHSIQESGYNLITNEITGHTALNTVCTNNKDYVVLLKKNGESWVEVTGTKVSVTHSNTKISDIVNDKVFSEANIKLLVTQTQDAKYKLQWHHVTTQGQQETATDKYSNEVELKSMIASASKGNWNRQGRPDPSASNVENIHNEIKFITEGKYTYRIYKNGKQYAQYTYEDWNPIAPAGSTFTFADDQADKIAVNTSAEGYTTWESGQGVNTNDWYAVAILDSKGRTFGTADFEFNYDGDYDELVYNVQSVSNGTKWNDKDVVFEYTITINKNAARIQTVDVSADTFYKAELCGFTKEPSETGYGTMTCVVTTTDAEATFGETIVLHHEAQKVSLADLGLRKQSEYESEAAFKNALFAAQEKYVPKKVFAKLYFANESQESGQSMLLAVTASDPKDASATTKNTNNTTLNTGDGGQWTGIDDVNADDTRVSVYPNPATDYITVEGANGSVALFSATGAQVAGVNGQGTITIDVSGLSKGVYVLKTGNVTEKILIK